MSKVGFIALVMGAAALSGIGYILYNVNSAMREKKTFDKTYQTQIVKCADYNKDDQVTPVEANKFKMDFTQENGIYYSPIEMAFHDSLGNNLGYDQLSNMVKNYCPNRTGSVGVIETIEKH